MKLINTLAIAAALTASVVTALPTASSPSLENGRTSTIHASTNLPNGQLQTPGMEEPTVAFCSHPDNKDYSVCKNIAIGKSSDTLPSKKSLSDSQEDTAVLQALTARFEPETMLAEICKSPSSERYPGCKEWHENAISKREDGEPEPSELTQQMNAMCDYLSPVPLRGEMCRGMLFMACRPKNGKQSTEASDTAFCKMVKPRQWF